MRQCREKLTGMKYIEHAGVRCLFLRQIKRVKRSALTFDLTKSYDLIITIKS